MPTLGDLIDDISSALVGYTTDQPMRGTLKTNISTGDLQFVVAFPAAEQQPVGLVEIGTEVVQVDSFDPGSGTATVPAWGRGQLGTAAVPHDVGEMVTVAPRFPRSVIARRINEAVASLCPPLFGVLDIPEFRVDFRRYLYPLPARTFRVVRLECRFSLVEDWQRIGTFDVRSAGANLWIPDKYARAYVRGQVAAQPAPLQLEADDFASVTGLPESCADLVLNAVVARLVLAGDLARTSTGSVESSLRNKDVPAGAGAAIARFHMQLNTDRLVAERERLNQLYPPLVVRKA
jgi:hypothetical protein